MSKGQSLQDPFLNALRKDRIPVSIFLVNGIKLQGQIESFDQYVVLLKNTVSQMVYKHAISTVVPTRNPRSEGTLTSGGGYTEGSPGVMSSGTYQAGGFERQGGFERANMGYPNVSRPQGGFTRTPPSSFDRNSGYQTHTGSIGQSGFERDSRTFERASFDRSGFEERGFDGKSFEDNKSHGFGRSGFNAKDARFGDDFEE